MHEILRHLKAVAGDFDGGRQNVSPRKDAVVLVNILETPNLSRYATRDRSAYSSRRIVVGKYVPSKTTVNTGVRIILVHVFKGGCGCRLSKVDELLCLEFSH